MTVPQFIDSSPRRIPCMVLPNLTNLVESDRESFMQISAS